MTPPTREEVEAALTRLEKFDHIGDMAPDYNTVLSGCRALLASQPRETALFERLGRVWVIERVTWVKKDRVAVRIFDLWETADNHCEVEGKDFLNALDLAIRHRDRHFPQPDTITTKEKP